MSRREGEEQESIGAVGPVSESKFLLYRTEDGRQRIEVCLSGETVWLTLGQMTELLQSDKFGIFQHRKIATTQVICSARQPLRNLHRFDRKALAVFTVSSSSSPWTRNTRRVVKGCFVVRMQERPGGDVSPERRP